LTKTVPRDALPLIFDVVRKLEQEYAYTLLDGICRGGVGNLPKLSSFEDMERANLALLAEKMGLTLRLSIQMEKIHAWMLVSVSRYGLFRTN
jgi:hypothetical protein